MSKTFTGKFLHFRSVTPIGLKRTEIDARGGATVSYVEKDGKVYAAIAYCNPKDNFSKHYGRCKADGRLDQLLARPELADKDKYHVQNDGDVDGFVDLLRAFLVEDMGYVEGTRRARPAAAPAA